MTKTVRLNQKDLERLAKDLEDYEKSLNDKCREFVNRLLKIGVDVANVRISKGNPDSDTPKPIAFKIDASGNPVVGKLIIEGEGVLFWEFGSGNFYNPQENPKAAEFGMGVGTYPGQTHVPDPGYWFYGSGKYSKGTMATMPAFMATTEMYNSIEEVAREVFGNG